MDLSVDHPRAQAAIGFQFKDRLHDAVDVGQVDVGNRIDGILEQLGRMVMQNRLTHSDCVAVADLAIRAVMGGCANREVENTVFEVKFDKETLQKALTSTLGNAIMKMQIKLGRVAGGIHYEQRRNS